MGTTVVVIAHHAHTTGHGETAIIVVAVGLAVIRLALLAREAFRGVRS